VSEPFVEAFRQGLRVLGSVEGQHLAGESRWAHGQVEALPALATELVQLPGDLRESDRTVTLSDRIFHAWEVRDDTAF
jgi:hypothetical protein